MSTTKEDEKVDYEMEADGRFLRVIIRPENYNKRRTRHLELYVVKGLTESFVNDWIKALRSGDYIQSKDSLCKKLNGSYGYCCLGVAARVRGYSRKLIFEKNFLKGGMGGRLVRLPRAMWSSGLNEFFSSLNDQGLSFEQIADIIERAYDEAKYM